MALGPSVQIREACGNCDGSGRHVAEAGAGHVTWSRRVGCETCEGSGYVLRWVSLPELRALLRDEA
jgi:DnaJ-class molecular chaperone